jgi:CHAT domain-containing protein/Tfp pilus assembly protein PilF
MFTDQNECHKFAPVDRFRYSHRGVTMKNNLIQHVLGFILIMAGMLILSGGIVSTAHAAPSSQAGDDATLRVINESEETICHVFISPVTTDEWGNDWLYAEEIISSGKSRDFVVVSGSYNVALVSCDSDALLEERSVTITADGYNLRFMSSTNAEQGSDCDALVEEGIELFHHSQFHEALVPWETALACYREAGDQEDEGGTLHNLGTVYLNLGRYSTTIDYYESALTIAQEIDDQKLEGRVLGSLGIVYYSLGQYATAIDYLKQALIIAQELGDRHGEGNHLGSLGIAYRLLGQYTTAIDYFEQALVIAQELGDQNMEGNILGNLGNVYNNLGQYTTAIDYYEQVLIIAQKTGDRQSEGLALSNLGSAYSGLGQYTTAIDYYEQALVIAQEIGDRPNEGNHLGGLGIAYSGLGQYTTAIDYFEQGLVIAREIGDRRGEGRRLGHLGGAYHGLGQYLTAIDYFEQALVISREIGDRTEEGAALGYLGIIYNSLGQYATAIDHYEQALVIALEVGDRHSEGILLGNLGLAYYSLGQYAMAFAYYEQALTIAQAVGDRELEGWILGGLGIAYKSLGQHTTAINYFEQAIAIVETLRGELDMEEFKSSFSSKYMYSYQGMIVALNRRSRYEEAFHYTQRAKARTFLDQMGNAGIDPRTTDDPELIEQEQALLGEIRDLEAVLSGQRSFETLSATRGGGPNTLTDEQRVETQARLDEAYQEYEHLLVQIKISNPAYADLRTVNASTLLTVQQTLPANTTLVEYYMVSSTQTLAFIVTPEALHTVPLSVSVEALNQKIDWFRQFTSAEETQATAQTLYAWLFAPLREYIATPAVLIAPHQQLHYLPFDALYDGEHYLVEEYTIGYIPSASVLRYLIPDGQVDTGVALVLGNPTHNAAPSLPAAEQEAQAVADLFGTAVHLGGSATESLLWEQAPNADYIHLAAHGEFNATVPQFSRIYLTPVEAEAIATHPLASQTDGLLETREVWNLGLENADLVTLSACQTQLGELSAGDELVGLSRAFIYAGTPSLVASLWTVEDESTAYLMERFYGYLNEGIGKAEALRQAKLDTMEVYLSPYHWAAFTLIGDMGAVDTERGPLTPADICPGIVMPLALGIVAYCENQRRRRRQ